MQTTPLKHYVQCSCKSKISFFISPFAGTVLLPPSLAPANTEMLIHRNDLKPVVKRLVLLMLRVAPQWWSITMLLLQCNVFSLFFANCLNYHDCVFFTSMAHMMAILENKEDKRRFISYFWSLIEMTLNVKWFASLSLLFSCNVSGTHWAWIIRKYVHITANPFTLWSHGGKIV